jgi:glycosyltransferase involved in cell wall biosynthesis
MGKNKLPKFPLVTICTPTFNRRPFIPIMIKCFEHQTYPKDKIEWIIVDDGTDKIEDLVSHIPQVKYLKFDEKMRLGKKRNILNDNSRGDIIVFMDDDDYYPPDRISHVVEKLKSNPRALCAGSSEMFIFFKHINKMYKFGPYGPNHATAATFAFRRELLSKTRFDETNSVAEEKKFLKEYTIPFVQLDSKKTILVFSHNHNSFDKKLLLDQAPNPFINETQIKPRDLVKEPEILQFFMNDIDKLLDNYEPGKPENKPDVTKQLKEIKENRENMIKEHIKKQQNYQDTMNKIQFLMQNPNQPQVKAEKVVQKQPQPQPQSQSQIPFQQPMQQPVNQMQLNNTTQTQQIKQLFSNEEVQNIIDQQGNTINEQAYIIEQLVIQNQQLKQRIQYLENLKPQEVEEDAQKVQEASQELEEESQEVEEVEEPAEQTQEEPDKQIIKLTKITPTIKYNA